MGADGITKGVVGRGGFGKDHAIQVLVEPRRLLPARPELEGYQMGRYLLLWLIGIPIPILFLIWIFGGLH